MTIWTKWLQVWRKYKFTNTSLNKVRKEDFCAKCSARHKDTHLTVKCAANREMMQNTTDANKKKEKTLHINQSLKQKCSKTAGGALSGTAQWRERDMSKLRTAANNSRKVQLSKLTRLVLEIHVSNNRQLYLHYIDDFFLTFPKKILKLCCCFDVKIKHTNTTDSLEKVIV